MSDTQPTPDIDADLIELALRQPTLREQLAIVLDLTAALGTPEVVYRRQPGESEADAAARLRAEVLDTADHVIALLDARAAVGHCTEVPIEKGC